MPQWKSPLPTTTHQLSTLKVAFFLWRLSDGRQRAAVGSCPATEAADALVVATRAGEHRRCSCHCTPPLGAAWWRCRTSSYGNRRQWQQGGRGPREARRPTGAEGASTGDAVGSLEGSRAAAVGRSPGVQGCGGAVGGHVAAESIDSSSLCFLTASALEARRREEEEKEKVMEELNVLVRFQFNQLTPDQRAVVRRPSRTGKHGPLPARQGGRRKIEEKEAKRRSSRRLLLVLLIAKVGDVLVLSSDMFQQSNVLLVPLIQFIDDFWTFLLCSRDRLPQVLCGSDCRKLRKLRSCSSSRTSTLPCRGAEADSHGPCDHRVSPLARRCGGRCPHMQVVQVSLSRCRGFPIVQTVRRTIEIPSRSSTR